MIGNKKDVINYALDAPEGVMLEVKEWKAKRTLTQNSYFHSLVGKIAEAVGSSITEVKNELVADYGVADTDVMPLWLRLGVEWKKLNIHLCPSPNYEVIEGETHQHFYVMKSTKEMTTKEFSHLVDGTVEEAKTLGIETLPPHMLAELRRREEKNGTMERGT